MAKSRAQQKPKAPIASVHTGPFERVYFVGAGFSAGMGYPIGARLLPMLVKRLLGLKDDGGKHPAGSLGSRYAEPEYRVKIVRAIERVLAQYFAVHQPLVGATVAQIDEAFSEVDLSEFFTVVQAFSEGTAPLPRLMSGGVSSPHLNGEDLPVEDLYGCLTAVTRTCFVDIFAKYACPASVDSVLRMIDPTRHAIVTYNWDEEVDVHICQQLKEDVSYLLGEWEVYRAREKPIHLLLKPHGSIGWYDVGQGLSNEELCFVVGEDRRLKRHQRRLVAYYEIELPVDLDGGKPHLPHQCPPVITPPTYAKTFSYEEQRLIWRDVFHVCSGAREFVFLGYSLPRDDFWTRAAIRLALYNHRHGERVRVVLVNRACDSEVLANYRSVFGDGFLKGKHFLPADFGNGDRTLGQQIEAKMATADVATE